MLAAGELRNDAAVAGVGGDLRGDDRRKRARSALDNGCGGFVAGGLDAEDEAGAGHGSSLVARSAASATALRRASENRWNDDGWKRTIRSGVEDRGDAARAKGTRRTSRADACAICCWGASRLTTMWRRARRLTWCWRCFRGRLPWARTLAWCWWLRKFGRRRLCHGGGDVSFGFVVFRWAASRCGALHEDRRRGCAAARLHDQWAAAGPAAMEGKQVLRLRSPRRPPLRMTNRWQREPTCAARSSITWAASTTWMRAWCARLGGRSSGLKKTICACCAGCGLRRGLGSNWKRRRSARFARWLRESMP